MELIKNYATQKSTWVGLLKIAAAVGLFSFAPAVEDQIVDVSITVSEALLGIIGLYFVIKNDKKDVE